MRSRLLLIACALLLGVAVHAEDYDGPPPVADYDGPPPARKQKADDSNKNQWIVVMAGITKWEWDVARAVNISGAREETIELAMKKAKTR